VAAESHLFGMAPQNPVRMEVVPAAGPLYKPTPLELFLYGYSRKTGNTLAPTLSSSQIRKSRHS